MEEPYMGRVTIQDNITDLQIMIPAKRNWFIILFIGAWLVGWLVGETLGLGAVIGLFGSTLASVFILFWLVVWTVGGFFIFRFFLWTLKGKEIIAVGQGVLSIDRKGLLLFKPKVYDLNEVRNLRIQGDKVDLDELFDGRRNYLGPFFLGGRIRFDYGLEMVRFANGIDEAEARFIIDKLKERGILIDQNWG